jgi:sigma-B regulation protein RsbU (phosphoserine phosphatase)
MTIAPVLDDNGEITNYVAIKQDITARKQAEHALAHQLALTRSLVDTLPNPVFVKDPDTRFILFNKAYEEAFGMQRKDYLKRTVMDLDYIPLEARERFQAEDEGVIKSGGTIHREREVMFADGMRHHVLYWVTRFELDEGSVGGLVGILVDITQQKELEQELARANERMGNELSIGHEIQMSMLPLTFPAFPDHDEFDVRAVLQPAREVGGDFYDFFFIDEDRFCFCVGDVSGKGVPSALFMAVTKTLIKSRATNDLSTASIMTHVNDEISEDNPSSMFITIFIAIMNVKTGEVVYTNAGHNPPYIIRKSGSLECIKDRHGPVIGAVAGMTYKESTGNLYNGDFILLFTDGVTEAMNEKKQLYSDQRLADFLTTNKFDTVDNLVAGVNKSVEQFQGKAEQFDDITILAVQNNGTTASATLSTREIIIENSISEMSKVVKQFSDFAEENQIPTDISRKMQIVFDELLNNIISYAYHDDAKHKIAIKIELFGDRLTIVIIDDGVPFNPFQLEAPDTDLPLEDREIGGLGIHIVHSMMDNVLYQRGIDKNIVTLVKKLKP